jgi:hypothetical protein
MIVCTVFSRVDPFSYDAFQDLVRSGCSPEADGDSEFLVYDQAELHLESIFGGGMRLPHASQSSY